MARGPDLLPAPREPACVVCGGPVSRLCWTQLPLLRHAGYGEAQCNEVEQCTSCGSVRQVAVTAVNPLAPLDGAP